jgi:hypothetical protein
MTDTDTGWAAIRQVWSDPRRWEAIVLTALPSAVFIGAAALWSLRPAILAAAVTAAVVLGYRLIRRQPARSSLPGALIVALCATVAAITGEARGFFLLPAMVPFAVLLVCLATIVVRRPLTGLILNRVTGGPADWYRNRRLFRVHLIATSAAIGVNVVNAVIQVLFYGRGDTAVLAVAHAATAPVFATLVAVTLVAARRAVRGDGVH